MRLPLRTFCVALALVLAGEAAAQVAADPIPMTQVPASEISIGVAAPLSGPSAILGQQIRTGASMAAERLADPGVRLTIADDECTADGGARAARELAAARVQVVVGFLCGESIEAALPILKQASIPTIAVGVRTDSLTDRRKRTGWLVYRLGPRADSERQAAGDLLSRVWRRDLFAIVDDGTIYGRELAEAVRSASEQAGLSPVFFDTFRPQLDNQIGLVGRLRRAGATHVFVGGDREDVAVIGRDAASSQPPLIVATGDTLRSIGELPLAPGTMTVALPEWDQIAPPEIAKTFADRRIFAKGYVLPAYAAVEIAHAALAAANSSAPLVANLSNRDFATAIGAVRFDDKGDLAQNPYRLFRYDGAAFVEVPVP
jgi:branched-chain amino acid transport system substrate-binding protein